MKIKENYTKKQILVLSKGYNLYERIILKIHKRLFTKIYHKTRIEIVNSILK